jgi:hypothetical protein
VANVKQPEYPEHEKLQAAKAKLDAINDFLDWLTNEREQKVRLMLPVIAEEDIEGEPVYRDADGKVVEGWEEPSLLSSFESFTKKQDEKVRRGIERRCVYDPLGNDFWPLGVNREKLMAEYFGIDQNKLEAEKRAMLEECRKASNG